jgi:hypothetical protein
MTTMTTTKTAPSRKAPAPKSKAKPKAKRAAKKPEPKARRVTKEQMVIQALCRPEGATVTELMELTGWQAHSVRGFLSGTAKKKLGLTVERITEDGRVSYRIPSVPTGD